MAIKLNDITYTIDVIVDNVDIVNFEVQSSDGERTAYWFNPDGVTPLEEQAYSTLKAREEFADAVDC